MPLSGAGRTIIGDYAGSVRAGEVYLVGPLVPHAFYVADKPSVPHPGMEFRVATIAADRIMQAMPELAQLAELTERARRGVAYGTCTGEALNRILCKYADACGLAAAMAAMEVLEVLLNAEDSRTLTDGKCKAAVNDLEYRRINAITEYLHAHYNAPLRLSDVAAYMHISEPTLCRLFRRALGKTVVEYVNELRVIHACELLRDTEMAITNIAMEAGYNTLSNFNRMFMRFKSTTPGEYRRTVRSADQQAIPLEVEPVTRVFK